MTFILDRLRKATVRRVLTPSRVEVDLDLGFGVHISRVLSLLDFDDKLVTADSRQSAVHALVILIGGKSVLLEVDDRPDVKHARFYLNERIYGTPVGFVGNVDKLPRPILDVAMFMTWLASIGFDTKVARDVVHKRATAEVEGS